MKALKVIGILILLVFALGLIASLVLPKDMVISESVTMKAPVDVVWNNVNSWEKMDTWSPWYKEDPDLKATFEGEPGTLDSKYSWSGNDQVGSGSQIFKTIDAENHLIETEVNIKDPWKGKGNASFTLSDEGDGNTKVTWTYNTHTGIPGNLFTALFAKGMLSEAYQLGLGKLKVIAEEEYQNTPVPVTYKVVSEIREARVYAGNRELVKWDSMSTYFQTNMPLIGAAFETSSIEMASMPSALYFKWNEETNDAEMTVAIAMAGENVPEGYEIYNIPGGEYLVIDYYGDYSGTEAAHTAIYVYAEQNGYTFPEDGIVIEEYVTDPGVETDPSKWLTKISYPASKTSE
jgi:effector-binding domain-containing protein